MHDNGQIHITCTKCHTFCFKFQCKTFCIRTGEPTDIFCCFDYNALHFEDSNRINLDFNDIEESDFSSDNSKLEATEIENRDQIESKGEIYDLHPADSNSE